MAPSPSPLDAIDHLEAVIADARLPEREAERCARLVETLRQPVRIAVFGAPGADHRWLLEQLVTDRPLPDGYGWPTLELSYRETPQSIATLPDGSTLMQERLPAPDLMDERPVFLRIGLPDPALARMSLLYLPPVAEPRARGRAMAWAARRCDIAFWCTAWFTMDEAAAWAKAPETLKRHAFLVALDPAVEVAELRRRTGADFDGVFAVDPDGEGIDALMRRLNADIDDARRADIDTAWLLLHRYGQTAEATAPPTATAIETPPDPRPSAADRDALRGLLSEPLLYLRRRARGMLETTTWQAEEEEESAADLLADCTQIVEALRDRAADWPDDDPIIEGLRDTLYEAGDMVVLLGIEGGPDQAEDAAILLAQLKGDFERALAA